MADGTTKPKRHRVVTARIVVASAVVGVVLAVGSVPVGTAVVVGKKLGYLGARFPGGQDVRTYGVFLRAEPDTDDPGVPVLADTTAFFTGIRDVPPGEVPRHLEQEALASEELLSIVRSGTPFRAVYGWCWYPSGRLHALHQWVQLSSTPRLRPTDVSTPLRPIWPGLLANTLFYAALTLALLAGWRWLGTRRRRKQGRCVACGYELGEGVGVCPECGLAAGIAR